MKKTSIGWVSSDGQHQLLTFNSFSLHIWSFCFTTCYCRQSLNNLLKAKKYVKSIVKTQLSPSEFLVLFKVCNNYTSSYNLLHLCYNLWLMLDIASYQDAHLLSPAAARQDAPHPVDLSLIFLFHRKVPLFQWALQWNGTSPPTGFWQTKLVVDDDIAWLIIGQQCKYCEARKNIAWWWQSFGAERINWQYCFSNEIYWP